MNKINKPFYISLLIIVGIWFFFKRFQLVDDLFIPSPKQLIYAFKNLFLEKLFVLDIIISTLRVMFSWLLSFAFSIIIAFTMSQNMTFNKIISPYIDFIRYLPVPALIPLTILFFGIGESAKIILLFLGTFFQLVLLVYDDLDDIPNEYYDVSYTLGYSDWDIIKMKFFSIAPNLWNNCRITMGWCWTYLVIAELVASERGIGHMIKESQRFSNTPEVYAGIITMGVIGFLTDYIWKKFYPIVFKYKKLSNVIS